MSQIFSPGQTVYLLYWRTPDESELNRVAFYLTKGRRDDANINLLSWGMMTMTATWKIPTPGSPFTKDKRSVPNCPKCGKPMVLRMAAELPGPPIGEWVCPDKCDSSLDEVLKKANVRARQELGDDG